MENNSRHTKMVNIIEDFFERYKSLPSQIERMWRSRIFPNEIPDAYWRAKFEWPVKTKDISILVNNGESDFILKALVFNLFSKILFVYSRENYIYSCDYLLNSFDEDLFNKVYRAKFKNLADNYSFNEISDKDCDIYISFFIDLFYYFNTRCIQLDFLKLMENIINEEYFKEEFSSDKNSLSFRFIKRLEDKIFKSDNKIFNFLQPQLSSFKGNRKLIEKVYYQIKFCNVLFYPSSGSDLSDLKYINDKFNELKYLKPKVFIHVDYFCNNIRNDLYETINYFGIEIRDYQFIYDSNKEICVFELKKKSEMDSFYLVYFGGYFNEDVLKALIQNQISIPIIYAMIDGMTSGMGYCNPKSVPTIFYPFLKEYLNLKFIVTEQSKYSVRHIIFGANNSSRDSEIESVKDWLKNLNLLINDKNLTEWLSYNDIYLMENIFQFLEGFSEKLLNERKDLRLFHESSCPILLKDLT